MDPLTDDDRVRLCGASCHLSERSIEITQVVRVDSPKTKNWHPVKDFTLIPSRIDGTGFRLSDQIRQSLQDHTDALRRDPEFAPFITDIFEDRRARATVPARARRSRRVAARVG